MNFFTAVFTRGADVDEPLLTVKELFSYKLTTKAFPDNSENQ